MTGTTKDLLIALAQDGAQPPLDRLLRNAVRVTEASGAILMAIEGEAVTVLAAHNVLPLIGISAAIEDRTERRLLRSGGGIAGGADARPLAAWQLIQGGPAWPTVQYEIIESAWAGLRFAVLLGSDAATPPSAFQRPSKLAYQLLETLADVLRFIAHIARLMSSQERPAAAPAMVEADRGLPAEGPGVVSRFLLDTLRRQPRLRSRGGISYHALRAWRKPVRDAQLSALKALKQEPTPAFEEAVAAEMADWIRASFGERSFDALVPIPCGHSGRDCFARRVAARLADHLQIARFDAFAPLPQAGSSHPRTNPSRDPIRLVTPPNGNILLIDDVATSGAHIEEGARALRRTADGVTSVVWLADA